jgi:integrase
MVPIKHRDTSTRTRYPGVRRLARGRWLVRKSWVDPQTGRETERHKVVRGTLEQAVRARAALRPETKTAPRSRPRFGPYAADWLERAAERGLAPSTLERYTGDVAHLQVAFGDWWVDAIDSTALDAWQTRAAGKAAAPTVNGWLRTLRLILDRAAGAGLIHGNPARACQTLPEGRTGGARGGSLTPPQFRQLLDAVRDLGALGAADELARATRRAAGEHFPRTRPHPGLPPDLARMLVVLAWTGARLGEICALRFDDLVEGELRLERSVWRGAEKTTKTNDPRRITLVAPLTEAIEAQRRWLLERQHPGLNTGLVFPASPIQAAAGQARRRASEPDWHRSPSSVRDALTAACAHARVPRISPHGLRRTFEDLLREAGVEDLVRRAVAGWRSGTAQGIYATVRRDERDAAAAAVVDLVFKGGGR